MIRNCLFLLISLPIVFSSEYEKFDCNNVRNFAVDLSNGSDASVYGAELSIFFSKDKLRVTTFPNTNEVNILLNETIVTFKGDLIVDNLVGEFQKIDKTLIFETEGTAKLQKNLFSKKLRDCSILLPEIEFIGSYIPKEVKNQIREEAKVCMINELCKKIGSVKSRNLIKSTNLKELGVFRTISRAEDEIAVPKNNFNQSFDNLTETRVTLKNPYINHIVDIVVAEVVKIFKKNHDERVKIPNLNEYFTVGSGIFQTNGHFTSKEGYFSDVTTLKRKGDAAVDKDGHKFSASCGFGLSTAIIRYDQYKLKFGIINLDGVISAEINGITMAAKASVDYNVHPCKTKVENFRIVNYGKISIEMTGLSPFNSIASSLASWITRQWEDDIINMIKGKITKIIDKEVNKFECEKYRPKF